MTVHRLRAAALAFCLLLACALPAVPARAAVNWSAQVGRGGLDDVGRTAYGAQGSPTVSLGKMVARIIRIFLGFLGIIFVILLMLAGFKYMTAAGNDEKVKEAVKQIRNAIIGLLIILCSYAIVSFISNVVIPRMTNT